jgi:hypothetical protein
MAGQAGAAIVVTRRRVERPVSGLRLISDGNLLGYQVDTSDGKHVTCVCRDIDPHKIAHVIHNLLHPELQQTYDLGDDDIQVATLSEMPR